MGGYFALRTMDDSTYIIPYHEGSVYYSRGHSRLL